MNICRECNNVNVEWNGAWMQCANCGEVHERKSMVTLNESMHTFSSKVNNNLQDIAALPLKVTLMGKLTSRLNLIM
jgi:transcription initiation factor TFIIIB Brf1 subunit/transcription initiation factor TFIIB